MQMTPETPYRKLFAKFWTKNGMIHARPKLLSAVRGYKRLYHFKTAIYLDPKTGGRLKIEHKVAEYVSGIKGVSLENKPEPQQIVCTEN